MVGIIFIGNLRYCPYLRKYTRTMEEAGIPWEMVFWDRDGSEEAKYGQDSRFHIFRQRSRLEDGLRKKWRYFCAFGSFAARIIRQQGYDKLILLTTLSGFFLPSALLAAYRGNYIFDIRDLSYEHIPFFRRREWRMIRQASFCCLSSDGFRQVLPDDVEYTIAHNMQTEEVMDAVHAQRIVWEPGMPLRTVFLGVIRDLDDMKQVATALGKDSRFALEFCGDGPGYAGLQSFVEQAGLPVKLSGRFAPQEKRRLLTGAQLIANYYGDNRNTRLSTTNKFYDGLLYRIPQFTNAASHDAKLVRQGGVGIGLSLPDTQFSEKLYRYYCGIDFSVFDRSCERLLSKVVREDAVYLAKIRTFLLRRDGKG